MFLRRFAGIASVTNELLQYEQSRLRKPKPALLTPNSIDVSRFSSLNWERQIWSGGKLKLIMTCAHFVPWHGLDRVLESLKAVPQQDYELHLCGNLTTEQQQAIRAFSSVTWHGSVSGQRLGEIYETCDVGLSCYALDRKGMKEAASLKVREYLACGIPAAYGHHDSGFPSDFPYVLEQANFDFAAIRTWVKSIGGASRQVVTTASLPLISVESFVARQYEFARSLLAQTRRSTP